MTLNKREFKGIQIVIGDGVQPINQSRFLVHSQSDPKRTYEVKWQQKRWVCNCSDFSKHNQKCKHVYAVHYFLTLKEISFGIRSLDSGLCPYCDSKEHVVRRGHRYNRSGAVQRHYCKRCKRRFTDETAFQGMRSKAYAVITSLDLYYRGLSLRQVASHLKSVCGIKVSHGTIYNWIKKYVEMVSRYVRNLHVKTSDRWHADDTLVKVHGRHFVFWALLDSETRFLIALHVSQHRRDRDAQALFRKGLEIAENIPEEIVTDGLQSYAKAIKEEFGKIPNRQLLHLQGPLSTSLNNNKVERFHRTMKGRTKAMNSLNSENTARIFAEGFGIYYNFLKQHRSLNGKTPAQASGISPEENDWLKLISDAHKHNR